MKALRIDRKVTKFASARIAGMLAPGAGAKWGPLELDDLSTSDEDRGP